MKINKLSFCLLVVILTRLYVPISSVAGESNEEELLRLRIKELELKKEILELESKNKQAVPLSSSTIDSENQQENQSNRSRYIRGPRGGCYTYSSSGRKRYVDRSLCD